MLSREWPCLLCCSGVDWIVLSESRLYSFLCGLWGTSVSLIGKMGWGQVLLPCAVNVVLAGNPQLTGRLRLWALLSSSQLKPAQSLCLVMCQGVRLGTHTCESSLFCLP